VAGPMEVQQVDGYVAVDDYTRVVYTKPLRLNKR
jgi:hypothetical protein